MELEPSKSNIDTTKHKNMVSSNLTVPFDLVNFPNGSPAAVFGLMMVFHFDHSATCSKRIALKDALFLYLQQAKGHLNYYTFEKNTEQRMLNPGEIPDEDLFQHILDKNNLFTFESGGAKAGHADAWSIATRAQDTTAIPSYGYLVLTYPPSVMHTFGLAGFIKQFTSLCNTLQIEQGYAGYGAILPVDFEGMLNACQYIGDALIQYPGLDAYNLEASPIHFQQGIKSVNFLTAVSHRLLKQVGGVKNLPTELISGVFCGDYNNGVIFQAGSEPQLGSARNPPQDYITLGKLLKNTRFSVNDIVLFSDPEGIDDLAFSAQWLARFDD